MTAHVRSTYWLAAVVALAGLAVSRPGAAMGGEAGGNLDGIALASAITAYYETPHQTQLAAQSVKSPADRYTLKLSAAPNRAAGKFRDQYPAFSSVITRVIEKNGAPYSTSTATVYFLLNPFVLLGRALANGTPYAVVTQSYELPVSANVGKNGLFYKMTYYHDADMAAVDGFLEGTFAVRANDADSALACVTDNLFRVAAQGRTDGLAESTQTDCYRVDASGRAVINSIEMRVGDETLTFN